jgi:parallel beta-helix repeat protein
MVARGDTEYRPPVFVLAVVLATLAALVAQPTTAPAAKPAKKARPIVFETCRHGCRYRTIQKAVEAAGAYAFHDRKAKVTVAIRPGRYVEGVVVDGTERRRRYDGMTIEGTKRDPKRVVLEGRGAKGELGAAQNGIEAVGVGGLVLKNMWARNYASNGFFVHAADEEGGHCNGYTMSNLRASGNRSYGLVARSCLGGRMADSVGYHQGASAFSVGETPCDSDRWNVYGAAPCQRKPQWTLLKNDRGYENALGYSGANAKYVRIVESAFYDNGTGIAANTFDSDGHEPNGWNVIERDDVFWNNYNYFLAGSAFRTASAGLGELNGQVLNYPTGVGIVLYGGDRNIVRGNRVFGNYKWGIASASGPGETLVADEGNEARSVNNEIVENMLGREGADPNGEYDVWNDDTGGGNCWGANSASATFAPGNGKVPLSQIYPECPQAEIGYAAAKSFNPAPGLQIASHAETGDPSTILGYAGTNPPQNQQCSWVRRVATHPAFQKFIPVEVMPRPGEVSC